MDQVSEVDQVSVVEVESQAAVVAPEETVAVPAFRVEVFGIQAPEPVPVPVEMADVELPLPVDRLRRPLRRVHSRRYRAPWLHWAGDRRQSRADGIHSDAPRSQLDGHDPRQAKEARLRGAVGGPSG